MNDSSGGRLSSGYGGSAGRCLGLVLLLDAALQPAIAQAVVDLGIELQGVILRNTLQSGITYALSRK